MGKENVTLTKIFSFDTAHVLENYPGKCKHIHGHTYHLQVTITGEIINESNHPYNGMIIDFTDLKSWIQNSVLNLFDHALVLHEKSAIAKLDFPDSERIYFNGKSLIINPLLNSNFFSQLGCSFSFSASIIIYLLDLKK